MVLGVVVVSGACGDSGGDTGTAFDDTIATTIQPAASTTSGDARPSTTGEEVPGSTTIVDELDLRLLDPGGLIEATGVDAVLTRLRAGRVDLLVGESRDPLVVLTARGSGNDAQLSVPDGRPPNWYQATDGLWYPGTSPDIAPGFDDLLAYDRTMGMLATDVLPAFDADDVIGEGEMFGRPVIELAIEGDDLPAVDGTVPDGGRIAVTATADEPHLVLRVDSALVVDGADRTVSWEVVEFGGSYALGEPPDEQRAPGWAFDVTMDQILVTSGGLSGHVNEVGSFTGTAADLSDDPRVDFDLVDDIAAATNGRIAVRMMGDTAIIAAQDGTGGWLCKAGWDPSQQYGYFVTAFGTGATPEEVDTVEECSTHPAVADLRTALGYPPPPAD